MAGFDLNLFNSLVGGGAFGAAGAAFGVPSCMLQLGEALLGLLPTPVLAAIVAAIQAGMKLADAVIKAIYNSIRDLFGLIGIDLDTGTFTFVSDLFGFGAAAILGTLGAFLGALGSLGSLYTNYQMIASQIEQLLECLGNFKDFNKLKEGVDDTPMTPQEFDNFRDNFYAVENLQLQAALQFIEAGTNQLNVIGGILNDRKRNPSREPQFIPEACGFLQGTSLEGQCAPAQPVQRDIFRLVFGPPKSIFGQFILSNDGLYFDSQTEGIQPALNFIEEKKLGLKKEDLWKFAHNPNLGGRGDSISSKDLNLYFNTILDPVSINESEQVRNYYDRDGFLQELLGNRNKRIYDLSSQISDLETGNAPQSIIINLKQALISENSRLNDKINKRKKQIELAVVLPNLYLGGPQYNLDDVIPINDFSYLGGLNISIDLQKQKALSFSQADVSSVVSPYQLANNYVAPRVNTRNSTFQHLIIAENGDGAIIFDGSSVSSVDGLVLQTENFLTTDSLFAMYNFLDTDVETPSSLQFLLRNSASSKNYLYSQLVADTPENVFSRGLGIAYLKGITVNSNSTPTNPSGLGSYLKMPEASQFQDFLYNQNGASLDFWVHLPEMLSYTGVGNVSSLYRLVLANENTGASSQFSNTECVYNSRDTGVVRGIVIGFTRDRRLTQGVSPSNQQVDNPASQTSLFLAPTQSINSSAIAFINRSEYDGNGCCELTTYHSMIAPSTSSVSGCTSSFCHISITFDPYRDEIKFFFDGENITTSSMSKVFGTPEHIMPCLPTFKSDNNSFEYSSTAVGPDAPDKLKSGPRLGQYFTPWIVGGGYTDGMYNKGNFMGGSYGGLISGLMGYLGSIKFYSKPLSEKEVLNNYNTQKNFFKNIDITKL